MSGELFQEWVEGLDNKFLAQKRKVVDNCPSHLEVENLKAIKLVFLPPNTTSKTQPMDQGVIRSLKAKYRTDLVINTSEQLINKSLYQKLAFWMQWTY